MRRSRFGEPRYKQTLNTCILASYGVACFPFTLQPILDYFSAYCRHFHLDTLHPEISYESHFHTLSSGYHVLKTLHDTSTDSVFSACRHAVTLSDVFEAGHGTRQYEQTLRDKPDTLLLLSYSPRGLGGYHSVVVSHDEIDSTFYYYDTNTAAFSTLHELAQLGQLGHAYFVTNKS